MTEFELWELSLVYLQLSGNIFWEKVRSRAGRVVELWPLRPDKVRIIPSKDDFIGGYQYKVGSQTFPLDVQDVIHFKLPNPTDPYFGMAPLMAALRSTATDNEATDFTQVLLQNRAVPGVVIKVQEKIDEALADRLTQKWRQKFGGNRRGDPAFLQAGMDVQTVGLDLNELAFPDLRNISESRICMVFGVPPILVGANVGLQRSTFSNYGEARLSFWQETIGPLQRRLADKINQDLLPEFEDSDDIEARFDTSNVSALAEIFDQRWERADQAVKNGWITVNDARAQAGLDPVEGGDVFLRPLSVVTVGSDDPPGAGDTDSVSDGETAQRANAAGAQPGRAKQLTNEQKLEAALQRLRVADAFLEVVAGWAKAEMRAQKADVLRVFDALPKQLAPDQVSFLLRRIDELSPRWQTRIADGFVPAASELITLSAELAGQEIGFEVGEESIARNVHEHAARVAGSIDETSRTELTDLIEQANNEGLSRAETRSELSDHLDGWVTERADVTSRTETVRAVNRGAQLTYTQAGITRLMWRIADDDACPYCLAMEGKEISVGEAFLGAGESFLPEGASSPLVARLGDVDLPPLHPNCRCVIVPA